MHSNMGDRQNKIVVPLELICDAIEMADNAWSQYLDIEKMEVVTLPEYPFEGGEYDEDDQKLADLIEEGWCTRFFGLPSKFDIHEYENMENFVYNLPEGGMNFREAEYREIAIEWCEEHGFAYSSGVQKEEEAAAADSDDREDLAWEEIRTEHIVQDEWIDFRRSAYRFPDGSVFEPFYSYSRRDYVVIVASDKEGKYLCVRQFRQGIKEVTTEFPAGGIERTDGREYGAERGSSAAEDALEAAKRELLEETGYVSEDWRYLLTVPSNATIADNYAHIFAAENCRKSKEQALDETEFLHIRKYSAAEIEEMIDKGGFQQAVHIMAWLLARRR